MDFNQIKNLQAVYIKTQFKHNGICYQNCSDQLWEKIVLVIEKTFEIRGWKPRIFKKFEITWAICSNSEWSEQFVATECFFNLFLEVSQIYKIRKIMIQIGKIFWDWETCRKSYKIGVFFHEVINHSEFRIVFTW